MPKPPLKEHMRNAIAKRRDTVLRPLRLIHPDFENEPLYRKCYERFFCATGIACTPDVLKLVAKMPSRLRDRRYYKKMFGERVYYQWKSGRIEVPSEEAIQRMSDIVNTLKPLPNFEDEESRVVTEECLINDDDGDVNDREQIFE